MPLPDGGVWPPAPLAPIFEDYHVLDSWYQGNPDRLTALYDALKANQPKARPSQYRGGIVGRLSRWFWGQPTPEGEQRAKLHVPIASDIATMSADLLLSEPPTVKAKTPEQQTALDAQLPALHATLLEGAEIGAALGGYYLRSVWDTRLAPLPWISHVDADSAVPEFRWDRLWAVTFWRTIEETPAGKCLVHLERHEPGWIYNGLYLGDPGKLGERLPLTAHPETERLKDEIATGINDRPTAVYVPNMRPNRDWRTHPVGRNLGRSDFAGPVLGFFDAADETWTSWMRDLRLGKGRLVVPSDYLRSNGPGQGASFDLDRELYEGLETLGEESRMEISAHQFAIRVVEHRDTLAEQLAVILRATGYSGQSFGLGGDVAMTATEVAAKERRSLITQGKKGLYTRPPLAEMIWINAQLARNVFGSSVPADPVEVVMADSIAPDMQALATVAELVNRAESASTETRVRLLHPDWDEPAVKAEVARIREESGGATDPIENMTNLIRQNDPGADGDPVEGDDPTDPADVEE
ncbi:phage capsid protein [Actinomadura decatromicini]|uniref:phage capsid protein n=1 Tax=Actinomadura decatromicini TaxID=2604572 RepID=UPI00165307A2|nr:phage capsid protein [Actinomadura decatromicini]